MSIDSTSSEQPYGRFGRQPSLPELERFFFLDDADQALVARRRGDHNRLGFVIFSPARRFQDVKNEG